LRSEHLLTAAVLRLDTTKLGTLPLNVKTEEGGTYNPFVANAPLTLFATGVRNAFDLVWHSNGQLYVPTNGSAAGGNTPQTPSPLPASCANRIDGPYTGPSVPGLTSAGTESDYLYRVVAGGYYGHPNPQRCEWAMNGGNPTSGSDPSERPEYPVGTQPDRNWRGAAFDFGEHFSTNGVVEYKNNFFGAGLQGKLIITRYSGGDDLIVLTINPTTKNISLAETGAPGMGGFVDPLDVVENTANGNLYVSEYGGKKITLLRPMAASLPAPWVGGDIGTVSPAGSASFASGTYTVKGSGADIYDVADAFQFVRQQRTGDFTITARVASLGNTNAFAKAGVMIRETLAANAKNAFMTLTPSSGAKLTTRTAVGGTTLVTTVAGFAPPNWVRLQRQGTSFRGYVSSNGTTWTQVGATATISMAASVYVGLAVTSHSNGTLTTATFTNVAVP
jgi:regulation of enolase protein 1 (concanavalin A-like superfamily)